MGLVPVLVCGNELRGDDAAALAATRDLPEPAGSLAGVHEVPQLEADLLLDPGVEPCVVVDTVIGVPPGSVVVYPLASVGSLGAARAPESSHGGSLPRAVALAEAVLHRPLQGVFVGIGGEAFEHGAPLGIRVAEGVAGARLAVAAAIEHLAEVRSSG